MAVLVLMAARPALAQRLIIDSYVRGSADDVGLLTSPVRSALVKRGHWTIGTKRVARALASFARGRPDSKVLIQRWRAQLQVGFDHWRKVEFADVIRVLTSVIEQARTTPALVLNDKTVRDELLDAHVALALAYKRSGKLAPAERVMRQLIRGFPDKKIPFNTFGPEPQELRERVERTMRARHRGKLVITIAGSKDATLYVNERPIGARIKTTLWLYPGRYRIVAVTKRGPTRIHVATVRALGEYTLTVDVGFESAVRLRPQLALVFPTEAARQAHEIPYALKLSRLVGLQGAIVLGVRTIRGRRAMVGRVVSVKGSIVREGFVRAGKDIPINRLYALADYLHDATKKASNVFSNVVSLKPRGFRFGRWPWLSVSVGVVSIAAGSVLLWTNNRQTCTPVPPFEQCKHLYDTRVGGIASLTVGVVALGASFAAWLYDRRRDARRRRLLKKYERKVTLQVSPRGWVVLATGRF